MKPLITIIIAVLNKSTTLERSIKSIINQTYPRKEIVIIDGGSKDGSISITNRYLDNISYFESARDRGISHAWNKGIQNSHGEWICFLGADDFFWSENVLTDIAPYLINANTKGINIVYGKIAKIDENLNIIKYIGKPWEKIRWQVKHGMALPHPGLMHHRSLFSKYGLYDEAYKIVGDYEFLLRELKYRDAFFVNNLIVAAHQAGGQSDISNVLTNYEILKARKKHKLPYFSWVWTLVYLRALSRLILTTIKKYISPKLNSK
ncbi:MAG: glycosyltransferase [Desulfobacterales bacterium]|nr:glycosyltransferase [Desulfobacterales bacterium]MBF0396017.1 glycosyltransferase [Desulfobacterales bacterium]